MSLTLPSYTLRGQDRHILKALKLMNKQGSSLLLVIGGHFVEAIVDGRLVSVRRIAFLAANVYTV
jgi:hypothetical protein